MEEQGLNKIDKAEIDQGKMRLTVIHRRARYLHPSQAAVKREIEKKLFQVFRKYG